MGIEYHAFEIPLAGTEAEALHASLNRLRTTFRYKTDELGAEGLRQRLGPSELTLAGLLKHLAVVESLYFNERLTGEPLIAPWDALDLNREWEATSQVDDRGPAELYRLYDESVANSIGCFERALARGGLDQPVSWGAGEGDARNLRGLMFDLMEEYGRHTGHADLLRENVDGRVGEDVPEGWSPVGEPGPGAAGSGSGAAEPQPQTA